MSNYGNRGRSWSIGKIIAIVLPVLLAVIVAGWFFLGHVFDVSNILWKDFLNDFLRSWLLPNGWNILGATPLFWLIVIVILFGVIGGRQFWKKETVTRGFVMTATTVGVIWAMFAGWATFMWGDWNGRFYNSETTYVVSDMSDLPNSLIRVSNSSRPQVDFAEGLMPESWEHRRASSTGAAYVMQKSGDTIQNSVLMPETVSYIYDENGGSWTGIRNGTNRQPIFGVASWSGAGEAVKTCEFKGENRLNKAFDGTWGMNLHDELAAYMPDFVYDGQDIYGYCEGENGDKPVIVITGARVTGNVVQAAIESFGVITVTGSPSGQPVMNFDDTIEPGELPGPAYPVNLVENQRAALRWSAGRVWFWQPPVGFEAATSSSQVGNNTDFLLKSKEDGRLYWVTPLKPRNTESETISAYALVAADEINAGKLNEQSVYVMSDDDANIVNFNDLENAVTQAVAQKDAGFFTGGEENVGKIVEFIPTGTGTWRVFAERGGRAVYEIHVSGGARLQTSVVNLITGDDTPNSSEGVQAETSGCDNPADLSDTEIAECISNLSRELVGRGGTDN